MSAIERMYAGIVSRTVALAIDAAALTIGFAIASGVLGLILSLFTAVEISSPGAHAGGRETQCHPDHGCPASPRRGWLRLTRVG